MYEIELRAIAYSEQQLFENLIVVWKEKNKQPTFRDMNKGISTICAATYVNRFGSWNNALVAFSLWNGKEMDGNISARKKRRKVNNSLRYDVMKRDNFKCVLCGESPATSSACKIEIDHILSVTDGGSNDMENLRTLCQRCNSGKFNK